MLTISKDMVQSFGANCMFGFRPARVRAWERPQVEMRGRRHCRAWEEPVASIRRDKVVVDSAACVG